MEWIKEILLELILAVLGVVITGIVARLGTLAGKLWKEKANVEWIQNLAKTCVQAAEQMYRDQKGEEKLAHAMEMCESFAEKKGFSVTSEEIRLFLEASLAELKESFRKETEK